MKLLILALFILPLYSNSQLTKKSLTGGNGEFIGFIEFRPTDYASSAAKHPLIIFLHGIGEYGKGTSTDLDKIYCCGIPKLVKSGNPMRFTWNGKTESFVVLAPQLDPKWVYFQSFYVDEMIKYAVANLRIDPNRIILTGLSLGGGGTYAYPSESVANANKLAGIVPVSGTCLLTNACNIANAKLPVYAVHSSIDKVVSYSCIKSGITRIKNCNPVVAPLLFTYSNVTHGGVWIDGYLTDHSHQNPNIYEWMLAQNKGLTPNKKPLAKAGADVTISKATGKVTLSANASSDPDGRILNYFWTKIGGPVKGTMTGTTSANCTVTGLTSDATLKYQLKVVDDRAEWSFDTVLVKSGTGGPNILPVANAGPDVIVTLPTNIAYVNGEESIDADGTISSFAWSKVSGPSTVIVNPNSYNPTINNLTQGKYVFRLKITDNRGGADVDDINITVNPYVPGSNQNPIAKAGNDQVITLPVNSFTLFGNGSSDPDGYISKYEWTKISGGNATITSPLAVNTTVTKLEHGTYVFRIKVTDNELASTTDDVTITVNPSGSGGNQNPIAKAGDDQVITLPVNSFTLFGDGSSDPDGYISKYEWTKISGGNATITSPLAVNTTVTKLEQGTYVFRIKVTDNELASTTDDVTITVNPSGSGGNQNPIAKAGDDQVITLPANSFTLFGDGSSDPDGTISKYEWAKIAGGNATITSPLAVNTTVTKLELGSYTFQLKVTDNKGATATDNISIIVNASTPGTNKRPISKAGPDVVVTLPSKTVLLDGQLSSDADGILIKYLWQKISGPACIIETPKEITTNINNLVKGTYKFRFTVTDDKGLKASDAVVVTVKSGGTTGGDNIRPIAKAGPDAVVTLPTKTKRLVGTSSSDPDGTIVKYLWAKISGPSCIIATPNASSTNVNNLVKGIYKFRLLVTDNKGLKASDAVVVTVKAAGLNATLGEVNDNMDELREVLINGTLQLYPNPANNMIIYTLNSKAQGKTRTNIYDMRGVLIRTEEREKNNVEIVQQLNIANLKNGVYYLEVISADKSRLVRKFVKVP